MFFKKKSKEVVEETTVVEVAKVAVEETATNAMPKQKTNNVNNAKTWELNFHGKKLVVEQGPIAKQADGGVLVRYEESTVFTAAQASREMSRMGYFPLQIVFNEKMYAGGKIPGGFNKREGRPTEWAVLTSRLIDRPLRPLFPDGFMNEVQIINYTLSNDDNAPIEMASLFGASIALGVSPIPFNGPVAAVTVGMIDGNFIVNPSKSQLEVSELEVVVAGTSKAINMVEAEANEVSEDVMADAIIFGHKAVIELCEFQDKIIAEVGAVKFDYSTPEFNETIYNDIKENFADEINATAKLFMKTDKYAAMDAVKAKVKAKYEAVDYATESDAKEAMSSAMDAVSKIEKDNVRKLIAVDKIRPDGRSNRDVRDLDSQTDIIPRVHGNAIFTRGETQAMAFITLGAMNEYQIIDGVKGDSKKQFMHHYNFPQFSVGSTGRYFGASRREIGHGALGERALMKVLPSTEEFPYTIRAVSEILESNGSTSQASICASSMALMAAGVPIKKHVAGIAMGLVMDGSDYTVLTDIQGLEDHLGDMDFKVAGTDKGICAIQMDIKIDGINYDILREAIHEAKAGRITILDNMKSCIAEPRKTLSDYAPKFETFMIPEDKIKVVIGKGGETITKIIEECDNVKIDITDEGQVIIYHTSATAIAKAVATIKKLTKEWKVGEVIENAEVFRIEAFGAFVKLDDKKDALVHISNLAHERVAQTSDVVKVGDKVNVKIIKVEPNGKVQASIKDLLPKE